jgi:hypothetical protein
MMTAAGDALNLKYVAREQTNALGGEGINTVIY